MVSIKTTTMYNIPDQKKHCGVKRCPQNDRVTMKIHLKRTENTRLAYLKEINKTIYQKKHMQS